MNNKNIAIIMTLIAGVILIQLISKGQPSSSNEEKDQNFFTRD